MWVRQKRLAFWHILSVLHPELFCTVCTEGTPKKYVPKEVFTLLSCIFYVTINEMVVIASESLFKKRRYAWHSISNIFIISTSNIGWLRVSLKQPFANFKKIICPKNVWMCHCLSAFVKGYCEGGQFQLSHNLLAIEGIELCCSNSQIFPKRDCCSVMLGAILRYCVFKLFSHVNNLMHFSAFRIFSKNEFDKKPFVSIDTWFS